MDEWQRVIDVNLTGVFIITKSFFEDLRSAQAGRIVIISSVVGKEGNIGQANHASAKSGLFGLTKTLAKELADSGTTVYCIAPGFTKTTMVKEIPEPIQEKLLSNIPVGRFADPSEIARAVRYLIDEESGYITGEIHNINGGKTL